MKVRKADTPASLLPMPLELISSPVVGLFGGALVLLLTAQAYMDLKYMILLDWLNGSLALTGLSQSLLFSLPHPGDTVIGAIFSIGMFALVAFTFRRQRGYHGLGLGDVKFAVASGLWIGWQGVPIMILSASFLGLLFVLGAALCCSGFNPRGRLPFGPFLCAGTLIAWLQTVATA